MNINILCFDNFNYLLHLIPFWELRSCVDLLIIAILLQLAICSFWQQVGEIFWKSAVNYSCYQRYL